MFELLHGRERAFPADTKRSSNVVLILFLRLRRWHNIKTKLDQRRVSSG